jgi:phage replication O-like protein O
MASPQTANGYTSIANEILEHLAMLDISGSGLRITLFVIRKTYGFHKKEDKISLSQICEATKLSRRMVIYVLQELEVKKILSITRERAGFKNEVNKVSFNKDHETWVVQNSAPQVIINRNKAKVSSAKLRGSAKLGKGVVQNSVNSLHSFAPTKETITKDNNTKDTLAEETSADVVELIESFKGVNPSYGKWFGNTTQRGAAKRLLATHGKEQVLKAIALLEKTNTMQYFPSITSPLQLEDKWAALRDAFQRYQNKATASRPKIIFSS